jgi:competence protein ComGC
MILDNKKKGYTNLEAIIILTVTSILIVIILWSATRPIKGNRDSIRDIEITGNIEVLDKIMGQIFLEDGHFEYIKKDKRVTNILKIQNKIIIENSREAWAAKGLLSDGYYYCKDSSSHLSQKKTQNIYDFRCD